MREGVPRQTKRGGRYWLFRPLCFEFGWGLGACPLCAFWINDHAGRRATVQRRFPDSPIRPARITRSCDHWSSLDWCPLRVSAVARCAPLAVPLRAIAALRLRSEHGSSHAYWARWGTIMRTSLASRASSDGAHPDRADSRIGPRGRSLVYRTRTHRCSPSPKCLPHIPGLSDLASTV